MGHGVAGGTRAAGSAHIVVYVEALGLGARERDKLRAREDRSPVDLERRTPQARDGCAPSTVPMRVGREHVLGQDLGKILATWYRARSQSHGLDRNLDHSVVVFSLFIRLFVVLNNPGGDTDRLELI
eukprot:283060-Prymnesium_polylepis.1